tara:strand:+ start:129 stop:1334 length:1206 start_codon:yes stop_codon:yes gene_type:complete
MGLSINAAAEKTDIPMSDPVEAGGGAARRRPPMLAKTQGRAEAVDPLEMSYIVSEDNFEKDGVKISKTGVTIKATKGRKGGSVSGKLDPSMLTMGRVLGRGAGGRVVEAVHKQNGRKLAIKMVTLFDRTKRQQLVGEIKALYACKCKCLVKFFGAFYTEGSISIALEFMDMGGLDNALPKHVPEAPLAAITFQMLWGLAYLEHARRLHRDIKPPNVLCNSMGEVKLTDFGISRALESSFDCATTFVGSYKYMSPERMKNERYSYAADMWSLGILLIEFATGKYPLPASAIMIDMVDAVLNFEFIPRDADELSPQFTHFVQLCLKKDPTQRMPAKLLLKHPWLKLHGITSYDVAKAQTKVYVDMLNAVDEGSGGGASAKESESGSGAFSGGSRRASSKESSK